MKKLFTLLTLLVFLGGGKSWGQKAPQTLPTTVLDLQNPTLVTRGESGDWTTAQSIDKCYYYSAGDNILVLNAWAALNSRSKQTWTNTDAFNPNNASTKWTSNGVFKGAAYYWGDEYTGNVYWLKVRNDQRNYNFLVTNCTGASARVANNNDSRTITIAAYETTISGSTITPTTEESKITKTTSVSGNTDAQTISITGLDKDKNYLIVIYASSNNDAALYEVAFNIAESRVISKQEFAGVKDGSSTLAETTDYTKVDNVITLTDAHKSLSAPENIKLINHITYTDASTKDEDVDVTLSKNGDYFEGTATIGATEYTVKVPVDKTPTLTLSAASGSIDLKSYEATGTAKVTLTGANLANGTFTAPTASGVTVTPATVEITDGTIDQEFTITSTATTAAETVLAFAYTGATTQNYTLNYSKTAQRSVSQSTISAATTWDWTDAGDNIIELSGSTSPTNEEEFVMANIAEVENDAEFNSQALKVVCQFPTRGSNHYFQGNSVKFTTSVAGVVKVWFSNTSNREDTGKNRRYLYINGSNTGVYTLNQTFTTASLYVPAGEVVINAYTGEGTPAATMVRIQKIQFDDAALVDADEVTVTSAGYATFVLTQDAYFDATDGVTAYAAKANGETIKLTEVKAAPASTPLVIKAAAGTYTLKKATSISPAAVSTDINDLEAGPVTGDGKSHYVLGKEGSTVGFGLLASSVVLPATKAYIPKSKFDGGEARAFYEIDIDGISTGINMVNGEGLKVNGSETYYDLQGRRVLNPTKGLYIVNGKKVVIK